MDAPSSVVDCPAQLSPYTTLRAQIKESAFDQSDPANMFAGSSCPFTEGDYYTSFTLGSGEEFCYGDAGSKVTITGNQMIMNTCSGSATYDRPHSLTLTCVSNYSRDDVESTGAPANYLIL